MNKIVLSYKTEHRTVTVTCDSEVTATEILEIFMDFLSGCGFAKYRAEIVEDIQVQENESLD